MTSAELSALPFSWLDSAAKEALLTAHDWSELSMRCGILKKDLDALERLADQSMWTDGDILDSVTAALQILSLLAFSKHDSAEIDMACVYIVNLLYSFTIKAASNNDKILPDRSGNDVFHGLRLMIKSGNDTVACHSSRLAAIYIGNGEDVGHMLTQALLDWIDSSLPLYPEKEQRVSLALAIIGHISRTHERRLNFLSRFQSIKNICMSLIVAKSVQVQYYALFVIWVFSFDRDAALALQRHFSIITTLLDICKAASKEKIIRLCVGIWRNYLSVCPIIAVPVMIGGKVAAYIDQMSSGKLADEEMQADVHSLRDVLNVALQSLNSFDEYASEIKSGKLDWSPPHKSDIFWKENAARLQTNDCEILRILTNLLSESDDPLVLAVAANDIGMYVANHTLGRRNLESLGTKAKIMALIYHEDPEVRFQALTAMQKYMKNLWS